MIMEYHNGSTEIVNILNQECVKCFRYPTVYAFRQSGHQCICENCYASCFKAVDFAHTNSDIEMLKCALCRIQIFLTALFLRL